MNNFIKELDGFYKNNILFSDTDSAYTEKTYWDVLDKAKVVGEQLCQGGNDYNNGVMFYGFFLAP